MTRAVGLGITWVATALLLYVGVGTWYIRPPELLNLSYGQMLVVLDVVLVAGLLLATVGVRRGIQP